MPSVADWLRANPEASRRYMAENPRYIFFRWIDGPGPIGAMGAPLTPGRSLAVDPRFIPYGAPMWLDSVGPGLRKPWNGWSSRSIPGRPFAARCAADFFWGAGPDAFAKAGRMKSAGRYVLFLPRTVAPPTEPD